MTVSKGLLYIYDLPPFSYFSRESGNTLLPLISVKNQWVTLPPIQFNIGNKTQRRTVY